MYFTKMLCSLVLIILTLSCIVETRSYNNGLIFYNLDNQQIYLPPTISVSRGRSLAKFKYSPRGSIWSTFGKPCDCTGPLCSCCVGMKVKQYNFDQKICANVTYAPVKDEILMEVFLNDTSTAKYGIAARNPSPICIPIMMGIPMSMCVQMSNVGLQGDNLNMCMDFMVRLASSDLFEMHFQCMKVGLQGASWVGPDGQPVIPANEGKIKDKSTDESEEYYDENADAASAENEIISQEEEDDIHSESYQKDENNKEEDLNDAAEEFDYNDITEKVMEAVKEQEEEKMIINNDGIEKENEIDGDLPMLETGDSKNEIKGLKEKPDVPEKINMENGKIPEKLMEESEINQMVHNNMETVHQVPVEAIGSELLINNAMKEDNTTVVAEKPLEIQQDLTNQVQNQEIFTDHMEIEQAVNLGNPKDEFNFEDFPQKNQENMKPQVEELNDDPNSLECLKETSKIPAMVPATPEKIENSMTESMPLMDKEIIMSMTTDSNYDQQESQTVQKFEILINDNEGETTEISQTSQEFKNSLEILQQPMESTSTEYNMKMNMKPTLATAIMAETASETGIDNIDNALTTASIMTAATTTSTTTTMKMPLLSATAENSALPVNVIENSHHDNDVNRNDGKGNNDNNDNNDNDLDNSHENDSDYDDEESEEVEDETTEKLIETNDASTIATTEIAMPITTNDFNNEKISVSTAAINADKENNLANSSDESNEEEEEEEENNNEDENNSKDEHVESDEYDDEEEEYEDYDATTTTTKITKNESDILTPSRLFNKTQTKNESTNKAHMLEKHSLAMSLDNKINSLTLTEDSNTLNVASTSSQMPLIPAATTISTASSTTSATTTTMPLPLARKLFALQQHQQRRQQLQQQHPHHHRYHV